MAVPKKRGGGEVGGIRVSNFTLLLVVFKRHHGSEGVNERIKSEM